MAAPHSRARSRVLHQANIYLCAYTRPPRTHLGGRENRRAVCHSPRHGTAVGCSLSRDLRTAVIIYPGGATAASRLCVQTFTPSVPPPHVREPARRHGAIRERRPSFTGGPKSLCCVETIVTRARRYLYPTSSSPAGPTGAAMASAYPLP